MMLALEKRIAELERSQFYQASEWELENLNEAEIKKKLRFYRTIFEVSLNERGNQSEGAGAGRGGEKEK